MTLSAAVVGALIREQIEMEQREEPTLTPIPIPKEEKRELFEDINGIQFDIGSTYMSYKVHKIVRCRVLKLDGNNTYKNGVIYPVNEKGQLVRPTGTVSGLRWSEFRNNYEFTPVTVTTKELTDGQKEAKFFTYTTAEAKLRYNAGDKAAKNYHKNVIGETIEHCRHKRNMSVIKDKSLIHHLKESTFWNELGTYRNKEHRFDNVTMASTIWRYKGEWIISSHSAYLKIMTGDR